MENEIPPKKQPMTHDEMEKHILTMLEHINELYKSMTRINLHMVDLRDSYPLLKEIN